MIIKKYGLINVPIGNKYSSNGIGIKVHYDNSELSLRLVHNENCIVKNGNKLITSTEKISIHSIIDITHFSIYCNSKLSTNGPIQISIKDMYSTKLLGFIIIDQPTPTGSIIIKPNCSNLNYDLKNIKLLVEIESVCLLNEICCNLPNFNLFPNKYDIDIPCTSTTTTTVEPTTTTTTTTTVEPTTTTTTTTTVEPTTTTTTTTTVEPTTTTTTTTTVEPTYSDLYIINLIDESLPTYSITEDGSLSSDLWSLDVQSFKEAISLSDGTFYPKFVAVFDIDYRKVLNSDPVDIQPIWPSGLTNILEGSNCDLPIPLNNIIRTDRPLHPNGITDPDDQAKLANHILDCINGIFTTKTNQSQQNPQNRFVDLNWGGLSNINSNSPNAHFVFAIDDSGSMIYDFVSTAITLVTSAIEDAGLSYTVLLSCGNERWLKWSTSIINQYINQQSYDLAEICGECPLITDLTYEENGNTLEKVILSIDGRSGIFSCGDLTPSQLDCYNTTPFSESLNVTSPSKFLQTNAYYPGNIFIGEYLPIDYIEVSYRCVSGVFLADVSSRKNSYTTSGEDTYEDGYLSYTWNNVEIPLNRFGLPDGTLTLSSDPDEYTVFATGTQPSPGPIIPTITFTYYNPQVNTCNI